VDELDPASRLENIAAGLSRNINLDGDIIIFCL
jgi:hypothetical protein